MHNERMPEVFTFVVHGLSGNGSSHTVPWQELTKVYVSCYNHCFVADEVGCTDPDVCEEICFSRQGCSNVAYPLLVVRLLPLGTRLQHV